MIQNLQKEDHFEKETIKIFIFCSKLKKYYFALKHWKNMFLDNFENLSFWVNFDVLGEDWSFWKFLIFIQNFIFTLKTFLKTEKFSKNFDQLKIFYTGVQIFDSKFWLIKDFYTGVQIFNSKFWESKLKILSSKKAKKLFWGRNSLFYKKWQKFYCRLNH